MRAPCRSPLSWLTTVAAMMTLLFGVVALPMIGKANRLPSSLQLATPVASPAAIPNASRITVTHGVASGDVTSASAVIWARASGGPARMHVDYDTHPGFTEPRSASSAPDSIGQATDFTGAVKLGSLAADTIYYFRVWFSAGSDQSAPPLGGIPSGSFRTAPAPATTRPISFVVGGDLGGQQFCRRTDGGYAVFGAMQALTPDFFIANGDFIYADGACPASGPATPVPPGWTNIPGDFPGIADPSVDWTNLAQVRDVYTKHWLYNRADPHMQAFLAHTPVYAQWDDHEVINDFGATWTYWNKDSQNRSGFANLITAGRDALFNYNPIDRNPSDPNRIYRAFNWGKDADLFLLDARSYRTRNDEPSSDPGKQVLGPEQVSWLEHELLTSKATWKIISSDIPLSVPTGSKAADYGRDAFANGTDNDFSSTTGDEAELLQVLKFADDHDIANLVFVTTDVHFPLTIRYQTDANGDGDPLLFHELVSGPLNAVTGSPPPLDPTLNPTVLYSEANLFNFAYVRISPETDGKTHLVADVRGVDGLERPGSYLDVTPQ